MSYEEDFPPVETVPFDPFLGDIAIRVRCPELNQRNTFGSPLATIRCSTRMRVPANTFDYAKLNNRVVIPQGVFDASLTRKICNTKNTKKLTQIGAFNKARFNCRVSPAGADLLVKKKGPCEIKSAENIVVGRFETCRSNGRLYPVLPFLTRKICGKTVLSQQNRITTVGFRRLCNTFPLDQKISRYVCRSTKYTIGNFTPVVATTSNASWSCRITEQLIITGYTFSRTCNSYRLASNLPVTFGATGNQNKLCKVVSVENSNNGTAVCHVAGLLMPIALNYTAANLGVCRLYPITEATGKRWRCGTYLLAQLDFKPYGRVWGATFDLPQYYQDFINNKFVRQTGRMMGKIRN